MKTTGTIVLIIVLVIIAALLYTYAKGRQASVVEEQQMTTPKEGEQKNVDMLATTTSVLAGGTNVQYFTNSSGKKFIGFYAAPSDTSKTYPGVVMIHEWWGLNNEVKDMAVELSKQGYQVLAVDLYGGKVAQSADEARGLTQSVTSAETTANMQAAAAYLRGRGANKVVSLGWCYGGGKSLELALSGEKLSATVIYYGTPLVTDKNELASLPAPVLGIFGDKDTAIPVDQVREFQAGLIQGDIKNEIEIYKGVGHAFANPSGANYAPNETKDAWTKTLVFLKDNLK